MFWADRIAKEIEEKFVSASHKATQGKSLVIRDEKTVSGRVHIGSLRGVAIHGVVAETLAQKGIPNIFTYEFNDFDPMDDIPAYLDKTVLEPHFGKPLKNAPSPEPSFGSFAEFFAREFREVIEKVGWHPKFYFTSELYISGKMDGVIREALEHAPDIVRIYKEVSGSQKEPGWLPLSVICERCGRVAGTQARDFDGETLDYSCACGHSGRTSPFGGKAKLPWKVEWPAKWKVLGVQVEGAGKDHSTRGGARDVADRIAREVFCIEPPFNFPYEFFLVGGRKMSSSKGTGSSAKEISELVPPKILRLALLGKEINRQINFDPEGDTVPALYDQYDKLAENYWAGNKDDYARLFEFVHVNRAVPARSSLPRFSQVAFVVQMSHLDIKKEFPEADVAELEERAQYAKKWLARYAPEKYVFKLQEGMPAVQLSAEQKQALKTLREFLQSNSSASAEDIHTKLHESKEFKALYLVFFGKDHGPKAGWFLASLPRDFVLKRLSEAAK